MARSRVVINRAGFNALRNSPEMVAALEAVAEPIRARAQANVDALTDREFLSPGQDITVATVHNPTRAVTFVATATLKARTAEHLNRALNRAVQG